MKLELNKTNRQNIEDIYPLSPMQEGMLFESLYAPDSGVYFEQITCILTGNLDVKTFEQAWQQVVARHPVFRTAFLWESLKQPVQIVYRQINVTVDTSDWRELSAQEQQQQLETFLDSERQQGFQLSQAPLMRLHLIQLDRNTYQFVWSHHHLLLDGWSSPLVFKDLFEFYQAIYQGKSLPNIGTVSYRNYIAWLQQQDKDLAAKFWRQKLQGFTTPTPLTVDKPLLMREQHSGYSEQQIHLTVPATAAVMSFVRQHQLTMSNLVQATWGLLLSRYSQETDVVFGATVSGRPPELVGVESIVGLFINTLPVRVQISEKTELLGLLKDLQAQQIDCEQFSYSSLVEIQGLSDIPRGTSLFESIVVFENYPVDTAVLQGNSDFSLSNFRWIEQTNYPLTVLVSPGEQLSLRVMYDASRFEDGTISRMLGHFVTMLEAIATNPHQQISQLPMLTESEQQQLLVEWNDTSVDYACDKCIHKLFEAQVERTPDAVAVVFENQQLTYHELNCRANQLAHYLQSLGVKPDVLVGICVERSLEMLVGILGILKAGGAYVPLDPEYPQDRLRFMLEDAAVSVLLTQQQLVEKLPEHQPRVVYVYLDTDWQLISHLSQENPISGVQENNLGYVIYTSGSTGQPKGVAMNQLALCNLLLWQLQNSAISSSGVKTLQFAPVSFDVSFQEMFSTWFSGGTLLLIGEQLRREPLALLNLLQEQAVERLFVPFVALQQLAEVAVSSELVTSNLREIITAGEQLQMTPAISKWLSQLSGCTLHNHYGPSESHVIVTYTLINSVDTWPLLPPIGRPIANTQIYILDQNLQPVPVGVPGELHIGGVSLARGYLNRPELTQEKFIPNPFEKAAESRLYKTGDKARYLPDGNIEYLGRIDNQVKIRGFRIELGEIEAVMSQYELLQANCVVVREDTPGDKRLVAYIVPQPEQTATVNQLRQFLKSKLPEYMLPSAFVTLESLPLTPSGKVNRRALPAPEPNSGLLAQYVTPRTPIEEILALIWQQVLKVERVGRHDNFFELGGHSLLATQLVSRVRSSLKVELPLQSLFAAPTIAQLTPFIQQLQQQNLELATPSIVRRTTNAQIPLSYAQQRLWFLDQFESNSSFYNIPFGLRLVGTVNIAALQQSLIEIIHRHEVLRTHFIPVDGQPTQIIQKEPNWTLTVVDLQHLLLVEQQTAAKQLVQQQLKEPFDLANDALIRATLIVLSPTEQWLLVCMHHIVSDGWSMSVFVDELTTLYNAYSQGQPSPLSPLPIQYADFALWQRQWLVGEVLQSQLSYWEQQLVSAPTFLPLPTDRPRPALKTFNGAYLEFDLSVELTQQLEKLSQQQGCTLFMTLLAAYNTLLYRYTGQEDILVGTPIANRDRTEIEGLIGFFVNTLVMQTDLALNPTFNELLARIREMALSAYAHQDLPFEMLVEALQPEREMSHTPLFQVMFVLQNTPVSEFELSGLSVSNLPVESSTAKFDLTLIMEKSASGLVGWWEYNTDLFDSSTIERMTGHFVTLLEGIVSNPSEQISQLPMLTTSEQQQLLVEWNDTQSNYPQDKSIHHLFEEQVELTPDNIAVVYENQHLTYRELNSRANQLAHYLKSLGVKADVLVGICVERSLEMVVGLLGILKAGGAYVPLDPEYPQERLSFMLEDTQLSVILTQEKLVNKLGASLQHGFTDSPEETLRERKVNIICLDSNWDIINQQTQQNPTTSIKAQDLAYVMYTSGSTGQPKGVSIIHQGVVRLVKESDYASFSAQEVFLQFAPITFDAATFEIWGCLLNSGRLIIFPSNTPSINELGQVIEQYQVTTLWLTAGLFHLMVDENIDALKPLHQLLAGGDILSVPHVQKFLQNVENCQLINGYGPTENTTFTCCYQIPTSLSPDVSVPIGRPIANTQVYILDKYLQPLPIGVPGELYISGAGLARGYFNCPELTQEKFIPNPFEKARGSRLYKTGDLARYLPDGNIEYLGRIDNQVKIRGFRIELGEIEAIMSQYKLLQANCAIVREDTPGDKRLVAYIVPQPEQTLTTSVLRQFLKSKLPEYMIPSAFVTLESLPLTPNGKVNRRALPAPEPNNELLEKYVAPRNPIEEILSLIWQQVLKVELVGRHDNFFELGGHSLLATQLISRVRSSLKVELPLRELFAAPTIAELSPNIQRLEQQNLELAAPPILKRAENVELPLSYAQQRLWFLAQFDLNSASYNIPVGLRLVGTVNVVALEQSFREIIHRHEALRTNFITVDGKPSQIIQTQPNWSVAIVDLQHLPTSEQEITAQKLVQQQAIEPFDLAHDALIRATLVVLSPTEQWLLMCMHHVVSDGWSMSVFVQELQALYNAYSIGQPSPLLPLPIQYADFALWQRQWLQGEVLKSQFSYWKEQLANAPTFLPLPTDRSRPAVQTFNGAHLEFSLSAELTQKLVKLSHEQGCTLFMTLLAVYNTLLYRYTGQEDILVGTPIANRDRSEIEGLIGFFVNTLVMRTNLAGNPSFSELLPRIREMALGAYAHQDLPFEMLVDALQPERDLSHTPLFQVMFVLQNTPTTEIELTGLSVSSLPMQSSTAKFDLTLVMENTVNGLVGWWQYNTNLFDSTTIERMSSHFVTLLESILAKPQERISQLPMLAAYEEQQLLIEWNRTVKDYPQDKCIHELFEEQVERTPDAVAVVFEKQQLTYHQLNCRANQLAHYLRSLGVGAGMLVGICVERSLEMVVGLLAILKAGGAYVPLDPEYPQQRLKFMLEDAQVKVLVTQQHLVERLPEYQEKLICLDQVWPEILQQKQNNPIQVVVSTGLANVIYTSGSTGKPKGVMVEHRGLCNLAYAQIQAFGLNCDSRVLQFASFSFDACIWEILMAFGSGARLYLGASQSLMPGMPLIERLKDDDITHVTLPPSALAVLPQQELPTLQTIIVAGEACPLELMRQWSKGTNFFNAYGPTEASVCAAIARCTPQDEKINIGRPIDNTQIYILDQNLQPVAVGVPGELHIGGAGLARGYLNRPELTHEKFIPNPFKESGERLYKTGDLARYLPDGNIEYLGRIDNQIKIRGFRIELGEIETILSQYPGVRENVVVAREDIPGEKRLVAYFVPQLEQTPTTNELRIFLKEKLPQYMVPSAVVRLECLPLTPNGKVDRKALPVPDSHNTQSAVSFVAPRTPVEKVLADIWANVLHLKQVGVLDNFFDLGGHSLSTIRVMSLINETFQIKLPLRYLFTAPTITELAQTIESTSRTDSTVNANEITSLNLQAEVVLDETIKPLNLVYQPVSEPKAILLTGATGFVGAFLLAELLQQTQADIYCLVRAANLSAGKQRLQETLKAYLLWEEAFNDRIVPVLGDLAQPLLGLGDEEFHLMALKIDLIYHNGALVNHVYPYALLKAANVRGTEEVLRLASQIKIKPVHFISTISVFSSDEYLKLEVVQENDPLEHSQGLLGGYTQSKWVAEKIVMIARDRGLPCSIYRLGRITWHSQTGVWNPNDMFYRFIKSCIQLKRAPEMNSMVEITPVDYLTKTLICLSQQPKSLGKAFHLMNSHSAPWSQFIKCIRSLGYPLQQLSYEDWQAELLRNTQISSDNALYSAISLAENNTSSQSRANATSSLKFDCQNTLNGLADTAIRWPEVDDKLLQAFFANFSKAE
jgi:amino acid adenylation domain-containing protein/thioester reductase-like protein